MVERNESRSEKKLAIGPMVGQTVSRDMDVESFEISRGLNPNSDDYSTKLVDRVLSAAIAARASDIHWDIQTDTTLVRWRINGRLVEVGAFAIGQTTSIAARIKSLTGLLTYRSDIPQEGRMFIEGPSIEARVGTLPTLYGERIVIRLAKNSAKDWLLADLGMAVESLERLGSALRMPSGVILITGPAGSGKTTTAYACLREILRTTSKQPRALVSLEDPIEQSIRGVAQSQIQASIGYTWSAGLKALLRQDPEVMLVGEIRDTETASIVFQTALTGQLVISTMHARSTSDAVRRLMDMHVSPHHLRSGLSLLLCQRLVRKTLNTIQDIPVQGFIDDRILLAETFPLIEDQLARLVIQDADTIQIHEAATAQGMTSLWQQSQRLLETGKVDQDEIQRHFGQKP